MKTVPDHRSLFCQLPIAFCHLCYLPLSKPPAVLFTVHCLLFPPPFACGSYFVIFEFAFLAQVG
jgi:hypothetical protein